MSDVIDLDAFTPPSVTVKLGGKYVVISPPRTSDILRIGVLSSKFKDIKTDNLSELEGSFTELAQAIKQCVPEVDIEALNMNQLLKLVSIITDMATPKDTKELEERGITVDGGPKAE